MYKDFFGFTVSPFNTTPDASFFFSSEQHKEALARLKYAIEERKGFVLITGEIGAGKTTLCHTLLSQMDSSIKTALITNTRLTSKELIKEICAEFEIDCANATRLDMMHRLNDYLIEQLAQDNNAIIIVDEAQNLSPRLLEEIRLISNLETDKEKLVQIILLGQPELSEKLELPSLKQLKQRIVTRFHLYPLSYDEAVQYIYHRLRVACDSSEQKLFTSAAIDEIVRYSGGIPRLINIIADQALLHAYSLERHKISDVLIKEVITEFIPPHELPTKQLTKEIDLKVEKSPKKKVVKDKKDAKYLQEQQTKKTGLLKRLFAPFFAKKEVTAFQEDGIEIEFDSFLMEKINKFDKRFGRYLLCQPSNNRVIVKADHFEKFRKELEKNGIFIEMPD